MERGYDQMMEEDYWGQEYDESLIYKFDERDKDKRDDFVPFSDVIQMAVQDYDTMVYLCKMVNDGAQVSHISLIAPEFKNVTPPRVLNRLTTSNCGLPFESPKIMSQDYDEFNLGLFYDFCKVNPLDKSPQDYIYPFVNLKNVDQEELDKFVIGTWVENHKKKDVMKKELSDKIFNAVGEEEALE